MDQRARKLEKDQATPVDATTDKEKAEKWAKERKFPYLFKELLYVFNIKKKTKRLNYLYK